MKMPAWFRRRQEVDSAAMSMRQPETDFGSPRAYHIAAVCVIVAYLVTAFIVVDDYGITWDEPADFGIGHKYLYWWQTGHLDFYDDLPAIPNHPDFYISWVDRAPYILWPTSNVLSAMSCWLFFQKLGLYDPISAHHIFVPILVAGLLYALYRFVAAHWQPETGLIAILILITFPRFFGHTFNNIKDVPSLVFLSLTILAYAQWTHTFGKRWLAAAFVMWWFALTTKADAVMVVPLLVIWQLPNLIAALRENQTISLRTLLFFFAGVVLVSLAYFAAFPPISPFPDSTEDLKFIARHLRYAVLRGTAGHSVAVHGSSGGTAAVSDWSSFELLGEKVWNLRSIVLVGLTTPVVMGSLFLFGLIKSLTQRTSRMDLLLIVWVSIPILRHCLPTLLLYDGIRLFLWFIIPFSVIASLGIKELAVRISKRFAFSSVIPMTALTVLVLISNVYAVVDTHPYQTTYANLIYNVLNTSERRNYYSAKVEMSDYWVNSYKSAGVWVDENAADGANVAAFPLFMALKYAVHREDLVFVSIYDVETVLEAGVDVYLIVVPRHLPNYDRVKSLIPQMTLVHRISRQGREIVSIYHKPGTSVDDSGTTTRF